MDKGKRSEGLCVGCEDIVYCDADNTTCAARYSELNEKLVKRCSKLEKAIKEIKCIASSYDSKDIANIYDECEQALKGDK